MISIDAKKLEINFTPRKGFDAKPLSKKLFFGHICPSCNNVIQAFFETSEPVNLWPYEETRQMTVDKDSNKPHEFKAFVPGPKDPVGRTQYNSHFDSKTNSQKLTLKNHILKFENIDVGASDDKADWEVGGKMCEMAGLFSLREDLLVRDYIYFSRINEKSLYAYNAKTVSDIKFQPKTFLRPCGIPVAAIGDAPPVILLRFNIVNRGWQNAIEEFFKGLEK